MEEMEYEGEEVEEREGHTLATLFKAANVAAGLMAVARHFTPYLDTGSVLRWVGLSRRRSVLGTAALLGAGALIGAGVTMFVSPVSGRQTRQGIARGFRRIGRQGGQMLQTAGSGIARMTEGIGASEEEGSRERGGRERGGREQGGREQGGREQGGREANRPGLSAGETAAGSNANRGEAGKSLNR
jgi:hypothetical protein